MAHAMSSRNLMERMQVSGLRDRQEKGYTNVSGDAFDRELCAFFKKSEYSESHLYINVDKIVKIIDYMSE